MTHAAAWPARETRIPPRALQDKTAARLTKARYQKGFMSTVQSDRSGGGLGGGIAKDPESPYLGGHTLKWLKVRQRDYPVEERGWTPGNKS